MTEDTDQTPRPLSIRKLRKSPSLPVGRESKQVHFPRRPPPQSRSFLGVTFPPQPKQRSSSTGVLLTDKNNINKQRTGKETLRRSSTAKTDKKRDLPGAGMAWLQRPRNSRQPAGTPTTSSQDSSIRNSLDDYTPTPESAGSSYRTRSYGSAEVKIEISPDQIETDVVQHGKKGFKLRRASSTGAHGSKKRVDSKSENISSEPIEKVASKGWKDKVFSRDFFTRVGGGGANVPKKETKPKVKERSSSSSSTTMATTIKNIGATGLLNDGEKSTSVKRVLLKTSQSWCEPGTLRKANDISRPHWDAISESNNTGNFLGQGNKGNFNDSVLGIFEGSTGGMTRTRLKKTGQWKPPILQLQMEVVSETEKVPISYPGSQGTEKATWISIELDASVDGGTEGFQGSKVGLDVGILIDTSAYTSSASFASMKIHAKKLVEAMEISRDRVAVMTFPSGSSITGIATVRPDTVQVLNSSGSVAKKQLVDDIAALTQNKWCSDPVSRNVRSAIQASITKLKGMPLDTTRYGTRRHAHLFLLTARLDDGEIELVPEVFFGEIQIHVIGIGPLFWPRSEMGASGWCVPTASLGPRPNLEDKRLSTYKGGGKEVKKEIKVEEMIRLLRTAVDLGILYDIVIDLIPGENCAVRAVMGEVRFPKFLPGEKRTLLVQVHIGDITLPDIVNCCEDEVLPRWLHLERQLEATLGELQTRLLTVRATYRHTNFSESTSFFTERHVEVSRFTEDSLWRFSPTGNKLVDKQESPPISPMTAKDFVKKVLIQRVASMHSNPTQAIKAVQEITNGTPTWGIDLTDISRELEYRERVEKRFRDTRESNDSGCSSQTFPDKPTGISLQTLPVTPVDLDCRYRGSRELRNEDRAPFIAGIDSSPETELPDDMEPADEAQRIWLEMKLRQRGFSSGRPAENVDWSDSSAQDTLKSLMTLRDVRETDFGPWAM
ncbi:hypothetical protein P167DRAFT_494005 [Morchella conica CCBAS932]|uniref:VWFA domain-containing protein n=1 Tax=Morchella conica CCBAS932 TaxID=1392247 RepID=A0A3N4KRV5_9PEZI|nr:hypothetical protein P167DRAFT_494005 [Morchella conica CCBAS932]